MSTHNFASSRRKNLISSALFVFCAFLVTLLLLLPSVAFAFASSTPLATDPRNVAQAGVSVVRLVVTYTTTGNTPSPKNTVLPLPGGNKLQCTGLGVLVSSSTSSGDATAKNVWVLTDGSLVNPSQMTCATSATSVPAAVQLSQIQVYVSNLYTNTKPNNALIGTLAVKTGDVTCGNPVDCSQGVALFGFSSPALQPYINRAQSGITNVGQEQGIELINSSASAPASALQAQQYLTPQAVPLASTITEAGMPLVDSSGALVGMRLAAPGTTASLPAITSLMTNVPTVTGNQVHDNWDSGIQAYYVTKKYTVARGDFQKATAANPQFQAGTMFATLANQKLQSSGSVGSGNPATAPYTPADNGASTFVFSPLLLGSVVVLIVLVVILVVVSQILRRRRRSRAQFKQDVEAAQRRAEKEMPYIAGMEAQQKQTQRSHISPVPLAPTGMNVTNAINGPMPDPTVLTSMQSTPVHNIPCPRCGKLVPASAKYCSSCSVRLSRSTSGKLLVLPEPARVPVTDRENSNPTVQARLRDLWEEAGE